MTTAWLGREREVDCHRGESQVRRAWRPRINGVFNVSCSDRVASSCVLLTGCLKSSCLFSILPCMGSESGARAHAEPPATPRPRLPSVAPGRSSSSMAGSAPGLCARRPTATLDAPKPMCDLVLRADLRALRRRGRCPGSRLLRAPPAHMRAWGGLSVGRRCGRSARSPRECGLATYVRAKGTRFRWRAPSCARPALSVQAQDFMARLARLGLWMIQTTCSIHERPCEALDREKKTSAARRQCSPPPTLFPFLWGALRGCSALRNACS